MRKFKTSSASMMKLGTFGAVVLAALNGEAAEKHDENKTRGRNAVYVANNFAGSTESSKSTRSSAKSSFFGSFFSSGSSNSKGSFGG